MKIIRNGSKIVLNSENQVIKTDLVYSYPIGKYLTEKELNDLLEDSDFALKDTDEENGKIMVDINHEGKIIVRKAMGN